MKKACLFALLALTAAGTLCAQGGKESSSSSAAATTAKPVTLRVSWWGGDSRHTPTLKAFDLYHEKNPNVTVSGEYQGWDGYYQKIVTQLAGGTAPDIMQIDQPWLFELCSQGDVFADLSKEDLSQFDAKFLQSMCSYDGKVMGLPTGTNANTFLVDVELLKKSGIDPNTKWTWENIVTEGKKVHEANPDCYFEAGTPDHIRFWFELYMAQLAGCVVKSDKTLAFNRDQAIQAFKYFKSWWDNGVSAPLSKTSLFYQKFDDDPDWVTGKVAAAWTWVSALGKNIGSRQNMETRQFPVMAGAVNTGVLVRPSQIFVVNNNSKNKAEALKLLNFLFYDQEAIKILGTARGIPSTTIGRELLAKEGKIDKLSEVGTNEGVAQGGDAQSIWQMNSQVIQVMQDVIDQFGYGKLTAEQAADTLIANLNATLAAL